MKHVQVRWELLGMKMSVALVTLQPGISWFCGYVEIIGWPEISQNILDEVTVWGGITSVEQTENGWKYGFDTAFSKQNWTPVKLRTEVESMALQLYSIYHKGK